MPYAIDHHGGHEGQVAAVDAFQSVLVRAVDVLAGLRGLRRQVPEQLTDAVRKTAGPLTTVGCHAQRGAVLRGEPTRSVHAPGQDDASGPRPQASG